MSMTEALNDAGIWVRGEISAEIDVSGVSTARSAEKAGVITGQGNAAGGDLKNVDSGIARGARNVAVGGNDGIVGHDADGAF